MTQQLQTNSRQMQKQTQEVDWVQIEQEDVKQIDYIQPHGVLFVLEESDLIIIQASENTIDLFDYPVQDILQKHLSFVFPTEQFTKLQNLIDNRDLATPRVAKLTLEKPDRILQIDAIIHRNSQDLLILELEPIVEQEPINFLDIYQAIQGSALKLKQTATLQDLCQVMAAEIRKITQFDRVMIYRFHDDWSGHVIAEDKRQDLNPFLDLHFPDADTRPCRPLYQTIRVRLIADIEANPMHLISANNSPSHPPIDISFASLRGVPPCHQEYLKNMGAKATLVMSLIKENKIWGLLSCHHCSPKRVSYEMRQICEFLGQVISAEFATKEEREDVDYRVQLKDIHTQLVEFMANETRFTDGLINHKPNLLDLVDAQGAVIVWEGNVTSIGQIPEQLDLNRLLNWLENHQNESNRENNTQNNSQPIFYTNCLSCLYPEAKKLKNTVSGMLSISIEPQGHIVWLRPELIQTVHWAGDPQAAVQQHITEGGVTLSPRKSFEIWKETVRYKSLPWKPCEIEAAGELRHSLITIVLRQAKELAKLARELERSNTELEKFAYIASHDLQEPLNLIASYVQLLAMRYKSQIDQDGQEFIEFVVESVNHMQTLIDDLLTYSRVGFHAKPFKSVQLEIVLNRVLRNLHGTIESAQVNITHDKLPNVTGDEIYLTQLFQNLISNAIKFRGEALPTIHIGVEPLKGEWKFFVCDNGIGIEPEFFDRIFLIFQRLHTREEYPGTGIGLAICKKIVDCHNGKIWVKSEPGRGTTFCFTIPA